MGWFVHAIMERRWLTLIGVALVLLGLVLMPSTGGKWVILVGVLSMVAQVVISVRATRHDQKANSARPSA